MVIAISIILGITILGFFITCWVFMRYCTECDSWIFDREFYHKDAVLQELKEIRKELKKLHKELEELRNQPNNIGFFRGNNNECIKMRLGYDTTNN